MRKRAMGIIAIPELLGKIQIKDRIATRDVMGSQKAITEKIRGKRIDYVLALKRKQAGMYEDVELYFRDEKIWEGIREEKCYTCTIEKAHSQLEKREYYQTEDWMAATEKRVERPKKYRSGRKND